MSYLTPKCLLAALFITCGSLVTQADLALSPGSQPGLNVDLVWNASPDDSVAGYEILYGPSADSCTNILDVGNVTNATVFGMQDGVTYYFGVVAYDDSGLVSAPSNIVGYTATNPPPVNPIRLQIQATTASVSIQFNAPSDGTYAVQATTDFQTWQTVLTTNLVSGPASVPVDDAASFAQRFYRMIKQ